MKLLLAAALSVSTAAAFAPAPFAVRSMTAVRMAEYDLDYGTKNSYVPAENADGGQGQFGAVSPNDWKVPGTSPVGEASYGGADDGSDEPWFSEAVSTVSLDLDKADATLKAFTKDAATFKIEAFAATKPEAFTTTDAAMAELVGTLGYSKFLEVTEKQLAKTWETLHPSKKVEEKAEK